MLRRHKLYRYNSCGLVEYHWSGSTVAFDISNGVSTVNSNGSTGNLAGQSLTLTGSSDVIIQVAVPANTFSSCSDCTAKSFTNPSPPLYSGNAFAGIINATVGTTVPTWVDGTPGGSSLLMAIAIKGS